jgi:hypothetical protein
MILHKIINFFAFDQGKIRFLFLILTKSPSIQGLTGVSDIAEIEAQILH